MSFTRILLLSAVSFTAMACNSSINLKTQTSHTSPTDAATDTASDKVSSTGSSALKLRMDDCVDPNLAKVLSTESITLCDGTLAKGELNISASMIKTGETVAGVAGDFAGSYSDCTTEGQQDCIAAGSFKAINPTTLAAKMVSTASAAGVTGSVTVPGNCSSDGDQSCVVSGSMAAASTTGLADKVLSTASVAGVNGNVTLPVASNVTNGVSFGVGGTALTGTKRSMKQCRNAAALATFDASSIANAATMTPTANAVADLWDTIDDHNNGSAPGPAAGPWGASYVCNESNFTNVSASGDVNMTPPNTTPAGATAAFSQIWRDDLTGLHFTNMLYDGSGAVNWAGSMNMCAGINSGDGAGNWRLPTQKELYQLYIDGIAQVTVAGGSWLSGSAYVWSSTTRSQYYDRVWVMVMINGYADGMMQRSPTDNMVFCVR